jgi:hypothetical protein
MPNVLRMIKFEPNLVYPLKRGRVLQLIMPYEAFVHKNFQGKDFV